MTDTKVLGAAVIGGKDYMLYCVATDESAKEITVRDIAGVLKETKDILYGKVMTEFWLTVGTGSDLDLIQFKDKKGGIVYEWKGSIEVALGKVPQFESGPIQAHITKGSTFLITTSD